LKTSGSSCGGRAGRCCCAAFSILLLALLHQPPNAIAEPAKPVLKEIRFEKASPREETIHISVRDFSPPRVFAIEGDKPRVVCDFLDAGLAGTVKSQHAVEGNYIRRIRVGAHRDPTKIRVVLDLAPEHDYDVRQIFVKDQEIFILAITPATPESDSAKDDPSPPVALPSSD
jgi:hypothetical protein